MLRLLKQEWKLLQRETSLWVAFALFFALALYAAWNGRVIVEKEQQALLRNPNQRKALLDSLEQLAKREDAKLDSLRKPLEPPAWGPRHPYFANFRAAGYATLPVPNIAALSIGQSDLQTKELLIRLDSERETFDADAADLKNPLKLKLGKFDFAFVIIYLLPLLILAFSFNLISGEKETRVLALLLSQPIALAEVARAKIALRALMLLGFAEVVTIIAFFASGASLEAHFGRLLLLMLAVAMYGLFWFSLALFVGALGKNSAVNALILAACWLLFLVAIPSLLNGVASTLYPLPSRVSYVNAMRAASEAAERRAAKRMEQFYQDHPELAKDGSAQNDDFGIKAMLTLEDMLESIRPVKAQFQAQAAAQKQFIRTAQFLSPAIVMQNVMNTIASTGEERYDDFIRQARDYHKAWREFFEPMIYQRKAFTNYSNIPAFSYQEESESDVAKRALSLLLLILIPTTALALLANARFKTYPLVEEQ